MQADLSPRWAHTLIGTLLYVSTPIKYRQRDIFLHEETQVINLRYLWSFYLEYRFIQLCYNRASHVAQTFVWALTSENVPLDMSASEDSDQPAHSRSLIRIFTERTLKSQWYKISSCGKRRLKHVDLNLRWAHMYTWRDFHIRVSSGIIWTSKTCHRNRLYADIVYTSQWLCKRTQNTLIRLGHRWPHETKGILAWLAKILKEWPVRAMNIFSKLKIAEVSRFLGHSSYIRLIRPHHWPHKFSKILEYFYVIWSVRVLSISNQSIDLLFRSIDP